MTADATAYVDGNPVGYDGIGLLNTFREPCPNCGERLFEADGSCDWAGRVRIDAECERCDGAWVYTAAPGKPDLEIAYRKRKPRPVQGKLSFAEELAL